MWKPYHTMATCGTDSTPTTPATSAHSSLSYAASPPRAELQRVCAMKVWYTTERLNDVIIGSAAAQRSAVCTAGAPGGVQGVSSAASEMAAAAACVHTLSVSLCHCHTERTQPRVDSPQR